MSKAATAVHPRVCGEQLRPIHGMPSLCGSSPRVRGTEIDQHLTVRQVRFIPACAGNRARPPTTIVTSTVHPRVCGEQSIRAGGAYPCCGSSPRVRGTAGNGKTEKPEHRFIPACAGNSLLHQQAFQFCTVHPRVCGEQLIGLVNIGLSVGSSPRVRGTDYFFLSLAHKSRFIPACAGNSKDKEGESAPIPVHPRVCGEQGYLGRLDVNERGSSPRVRGTGSSHASNSRVLRFIPACAGNSFVRIVTCITTSVHPRVCGEQSVQVGSSQTRVGSSPRVRGTDS